jgi:hypothetical protein
VTPDRSATINQRLGCRDITERRDVREQLAKEQNGYENRSHVWASFPPLDGMFVAEKLFKHLFFIGTAGVMVGA